MARIQLYPTHENALNIIHPVSGKLKANPIGGMWENDSFTARMLSDGIVTTEPPAETEKPQTETKVAR